MDVLYQRSDQHISGMDQPTDPLLAESDMRDKSKDAGEPKKEAEKKQPQPVELTDDQLLAITGGATNPNPPPQPKPD